MWKSISLTLLFLTCAPRAGAAPSLPVDAVVLLPSQADSLLAQCSRETPSKGGEAWTPSVEDILALESLLPEALRLSRHIRGPDFSKAPNGWKRQYVGIVRNGRRLVYGNFFPSHETQWPSRTEAVVVCDGGPSFFGVEYDVAARRIVHLAFNGLA